MDDGSFCPNDREAHENFMNKYKDDFEIKGNQLILKNEKTAEDILRHFFGNNF